MLINGLRQKYWLFLAAMDRCCVLIGTAIAV